MSTPPKILRHTIAQGRALLADWRASGQSASAFCRSRNLSNSRIDYWKHRLRVLDQAEAEAKGEAAQRSTFIQIPAAPTEPPASTPAPAAITVTLPNGIAVAIPSACNLPWLERVLTALLRMEAAC